MDEEVICCPITIQSGVTYPRKVLKDKRKRLKESCKGALILYIP